MKYYNICLFATLVIFAPMSSCKKNEWNWEYSTMDFDENFHDIEILDQNSAIAYSYGSGLFVKTINQGKNWKMVLQTDSIYYEQIEFVNEKVGFVCGNTNTILKTMDAGENWQAYAINSIPKNAAVYGMSFLNETVGYLAVLKRNEGVFHSDIYQTKDAGISWDKINSVNEMILNLEIIDDRLYGSGNNVFIENVNQMKYKILYKDEVGEVGQIRDFIKLENEFVLASFNGFIIRGSEGDFTKQQLTKNHLRSIIRYGDDSLYAAGEGEIINENMFMSRVNEKQWTNISKDSSAIHRLVYKNHLSFGVGKNDLIITLKK